MELAIPLVALGGLFIASNQKQKKSKCKRTSENFEQRSRLPNVDIPNKNFPEEYPIQNAEDDITSKLSTVNQFDGPGVYTDKFFNPNVEGSLVGQNQESLSNMNSGPSSQYYSLTGKKVDSSYFQHNNMAPFFGAHLRNSQLDANSSESILDNYVGAGSQIQTKTERAPLFTPQTNMANPYGMQNMSEFYQSRVNPSLKMSNVKPFEEQTVAPAIGGGYTTEGMGGFNSGLLARDMYMPRNVDEMRVDTKPKAGEFGLFGHEGPANSIIKERGHLGVMEKNRVDRDFEMGRDRLFTTVGREKGVTARAIPVEKHVNRADTSVSYTGVAASLNPAHYVEGEYMPSKHMDLESYPVTPAYRIGASQANEADYGNKSLRVYENNRSANRNDGYFGAAGGVLTAAVAPLMDILRPSRKENTVGTLRPYQNPGSKISNTYVHNPADRPSATIRETTELASGHLFVDRVKSNAAYEVTGNQPIVNNRQTQEDYYYSGVASAGERGRQPRTYDAEYNQRNNDLKSSTNTGYTPSGGMGLMNNSMNVAVNTSKDADLLNQRAWVPTMPSQQVSLESLGQQTTGPKNFQEMNRNTPDLLSQLKGNPFAISHIGGL